MIQNLIAGITPYKLAILVGWLMLGYLSFGVLARNMMFFMRLPVINVRARWCLLAAPAFGVTIPICLITTALRHVIEDGIRQEAAQRLNAQVIYYSDEPEADRDDDEPPPSAGAVLWSAPLESPATS